MTFFLWTLYTTFKHGRRHKREFESESDESDMLTNFELIYDSTAGKTPVYTKYSSFFSHLKGNIFGKINNE